MDRDLLRLAVLLFLVRLLVSAAAPAAIRTRQQGRRRTSRSSGHDVIGHLSPLPGLGGLAATAQARDVELLLPAGGGPARRGRTRRGGRGRPRGRRGGRRHRREERHQGVEGRGGICVVALNVRSLKPKILSLRHDLGYFDCDVCALSETWLKPETPSRCINFPGYTLTRADRPDGRGYGGVAILSRSCLKIKRLQSVCASDRCKLETLWVSVTNSHGRRFNVCALYRPPNHSTAQFSIDLECLESQVQRILLSSTDPLLLTGDINCNLLSVDTDPCKTKLLEFSDSLSLYQYVSKPTFRSGSLLDVFISNLSTFTTTVQVQQCAYSDHAFIVARLSIPKLRVKPSFIQSRRLHRMCVSDFQMSLCRTDWSPVFSRAGVADQWTAFTDLFLPVLNFHAPSQRIKLHNPSAPPVSDSTLRLMAQRRGLLARSGRTPPFVTLTRRLNLPFGTM